MGAKNKLFPMQVNIWRSEKDSQILQNNSAFGSKDENNNKDVLLMLNND